MLSKRLSDLLDIASDQEVNHLSEDTRDIRANTLFFCIKGAAFDSHLAVDEVIEKGAKVIVHTNELAHYQEGIIYYQCDNVFEVMASVSARFFDHPSHKLNLIGITGTNGKTTIAWILNEILNTLSKSAYIGTITLNYNGVDYPNHFTTPKSIELNYHLKRMVDQEIKHCAMEVSSHALTLARTNDLDFNFGIMSNLSFDHINFHGSMENYHEAKRLLFEQLNEDAYAILNIDDDTYEDYAKHTKAQVVSYGIEKEAMVQAVDLKLSNKDMKFTLKYDNKEYAITSNLISLVNVYNLLAAIATLIKMDIPIEKIVELVSDIKPADGRMCVIDEGQDFEVIVDYAHTPDGFEKLYEYLENIVTGKIISVFGSAGGDRDREKRPVLGKIASDYSSHIILTREDNRNESVFDISNEIARDIKTSYEIIEDRETAIIKALKMANKGDCIVVLAKGNEKYQHVDGQAMPYEGDVDITTRLLKEGVYNER